MVVTTSNVITLTVSNIMACCTVASGRTLMASCSSAGLHVTSTALARSSPIFASVGLALQCMTEHLQLPVVASISCAIIRLWV